jgi:uncharacterized protein YuzE
MSNISGSAASQISHLLEDNKKEDYIYQESNNNDNIAVNVSEDIFGIEIVRKSLHCKYSAQKNKDINDALTLLDSAILSLSSV